ncbi:hypothetical protein D0Y60_19895 [Shinella sp. WSJ-2]|uniref:hypothetical protein n=1 Tax=Shinella sp. WSJ-2 TaxID=2303749 RepID=UPI000E3E38D6|nr:hypothetical protein [Shinella sp. WSJ-2]RFZ83851.1 hypothetical protein D0Y60_19895 [Shinella sp. WSJ-2]
MMLGRFEYFMESNKDASEVDERFISFTSKNVIDAAPELESIIDPFSSTILTPAASIKIMRETKNAIIRALNNGSRGRNVALNMDEFSRSSICLIIGCIISFSYFKTIRLTYSTNKYKIAGSDLVEMLQGDEFWFRVHDFPSKLTAIPYLGGRFDASKSKSVFVCGGLDFGRVLNVSARWEPSKIFLVSPEEYVSMKDPALVNAYDFLLAEHYTVGRLDVPNLIYALNEWKDSTLKDRLQPLLVIGGWKIHSIISCLWAIENTRTPAFLCVPDFISPGVTRDVGERWSLVITDTSTVI